MKFTRAFCSPVGYPLSMRPNLTFFACALLPLLPLLALSSCAPPEPEPTPSPSPHITQYYTEIEEIGTNLAIWGRVERDQAGNVIATDGTMSVRWSWHFTKDNEYGSDYSTCITTVDESGPFIYPPTDPTSWTWELTRTGVDDGCNIGLVPSIIQYGWDPSIPNKLMTNRFISWLSRYALDAPLVESSGPLGAGTWEEVTFTGTTFSYFESDFPN